MYFRSRIAHSVEGTKLLTRKIFSAQCLSFGGGQQSATEDSEAMRVLLADVRMEINSLKNAAYASGFTAARGALRAQLEASFP